MACHGSTSVEGQHVRRMCVNSDNMQDLALLSETTILYQSPIGWTGVRMHRAPHPPIGSLPFQSWINARVTTR